MICSNRRIVSSKQVVKSHWERFLSTNRSRGSVFKPSFEAALSSAAETLTPESQSSDRQMSSQFKNRTWNINRSVPSVALTKTKREKRLAKCSVLKGRNDVLPHACSVTLASVSDDLHLLQRHRALVVILSLPEEPDNDHRVSYEDAKVEFLLQISQHPSTFGLKRCIFPLLGDADPDLRLHLSLLSKRGGGHCACSQWDWCFSMIIRQNNES